MTVTFGLNGVPGDLADLSSSAAYLNAYTQSIEVLGPEFTTFWASDHLQFGDVPITECWTRLTFLAGRFPRFNVGSLVLGQAYRNPALLAKMAATLQLLSDGRLMLGLGAAWHEEEFRAYNFSYGSRGQRVDQLVEAITILRLLWQGGPATFQGSHYSISEAYCHPTPPKPIPVVVGGMKPRMLRVVAEHADGWNFDANPALFDPLYEQLCANLDALGRSRDSFVLTLNVEVNFPERHDDFVGLIPTEFPEYDIDQVIYGPTPDDAIRGLAPFIEQGVTHFTVGTPDIRTLRLFAAEVAPALADIGAGR